MGLIRVGPCDADMHVARAQWVADRGLRVRRAGGTCGGNVKVTRGSVCTGPRVRAAASLGLCRPHGRGRRPRGDRVSGTKSPHVFPRELRGVKTPVSPQRRPPPPACRQEGGPSAGGWPVGTRWRHCAPRNAWRWRRRGRGVPAGRPPSAPLCVAAAWPRTGRPGCSLSRGRGA